MLLIVFVLSLLFVIQQDTLVTYPSGWGIQIEEASHSDTLVTDDEDDCASFSFSDLQDDEPVPLCGEVEAFENGEDDALFQDYGEETEADSPSNAVHEQIELALPDTPGAAEARSGTTGGISGSWLSLLPPVVAIAIALFFRQVYFALFIGIWMGAWLASGMGLQQVFISFFTTVSHYIIPSVASPDHISILVFILMIGAMVGLIGANGGTRGVVDTVTRLVTTRRRARVTTTAMGYVVFFDDYANTMIVGNTMRAVTDRFRISRAKLAYLVDSTAAPVAIIALISTWIGAVAGYILEASNGIEELEGASYMIFLHSLPYNFYAFFAVVFVMIIAVSGRDFGPMYRAEQKALNGKDESPLDDPPPEDEQEASDELPSKSKKRGHWLDAVLPIAGLVAVTIAGLLITGEGDSIRDIIGTADSYAALVWGSAFSLFLAIVLTLSRKLLSAQEIQKSMFRGMHVMFEGGIILVLAWSLGMVTIHLDTAGFLVSLLEGTVNPYWLPVVMFVIAGFTSFATGSSWGTMGIITPIVVPLAWTLSLSHGLDPQEAHTILYGGVSAVLAGAVWGDHCSPVSDTTILSSLACQCDHIAHVNTQLPYALLVGGFAIVSLVASMVAGLSLWIIYPSMLVFMLLAVYLLGKPVDEIRT